MAQIVLQEVDVGLLVDALAAGPAVHALLAWQEVVAAIDELALIAAVDQAIFLAELPADSLFSLPTALPVEDGDGCPVVEPCAAQSLERAVKFGAWPTSKEGQVEDRVERLAFLQGRDDIVADDAAGRLDIVRIISEHVRLAVFLGMVAAHASLVSMLQLITLAQRLHRLAHAEGLRETEQTVHRLGWAIRFFENALIQQFFHEAGPLSFFSLSSLSLTCLL